MSGSTYPLYFSTLQGYSRLSWRETGFNTFAAFHVIARFIHAVRSPRIVSGLVVQERAPGGGARCPYSAALQRRNVRPPVSGIDFGRELNVGATIPDERTAFIEQIIGKGTDALISNDTA